MKYIKLFLESNNDYYHPISQEEYRDELSKHISFNKRDLDYLKSKCDDMGCVLDVSYIGLEKRMLVKFKKMKINIEWLITFTKINDDYYLVAYYYLVRKSSGVHQRQYKCDQLDGLKLLLNDLSEQIKPKK